MTDLFRPLEDQELGVLCSFHYWKTWNLRESIEKLPVRVKVFSDSGGFSAATQGAEVSLDDYARFLRDNESVIDHYANLDVIGDARATRLNHMRMERMGLRPLPVTHMGSSLDEIRWYADRGYDYQCLGGLVPHTPVINAGLRSVANGVRPKGKSLAALRWLDDAHSVAKECGVRLHGFGVTFWANVLRWRWHTMDSSSWSSGSRFGSLSLFDPARFGWVTGLRRNSREDMMPVAGLLRRYGCSVTHLLCDTEYSLNRLGSIQARAWTVAQRSLREKGIDSSVYLALIHPHQLDPLRSLCSPWSNE